MKERIIKALAGLDLGYGEKDAFIQNQANGGALWGETSVLMLLSAWEDFEGTRENWSFLLNKRSQQVPQPGDLCFPGGHPSPSLDRFIARVLVPFVLPMARGKGLGLARKRGGETFGAVSLFLAGALREYWEETRISPFAMDFLGPMPGYKMLTRKKFIHPMAASLTKPVMPKTTREIEKNLLVPFSEFQESRNYGTVTWLITGKYRKIYPVDKVDFPCFLVRRANGEDILWGATFNICLSFLEAVFGFTPPGRGPVCLTAPLYPARA